MRTNTLTLELLDRMNAYWRAAHYLSVGQICLFDNPLLKRPLKLADMKHMLLGHREVLRILAVRWIWRALIEGRSLLVATASLSVLGYDQDLTDPVVHAWNGRATAPAGAQ